MKKIIRSIALLLLPILLYYGLFLYFERNNYFGLRSYTPSGSSIGALREYERNPKNSIIIGDSRVAHLDMGLVEEVAGRPFANLAYGGASLNESLDLLDWWMEKYPDINEVVFSLSFYTLNEKYSFDRVEGLKESLYNPFAYLTNLSYHLDTLEVIRDYLRGYELYGGEAETMDPADYEYIDYTAPTGETVVLRSTLAEYIEKTAVYTTVWAPYTEAFQRLLTAIDTYTAQGVRFIVVLPPMHWSMLEYAVKPNGIYEPMQKMLSQLAASGALLLDYEIISRPDFSDDMFYDGFHLDSQRGLDVWTRMLFEDINAGQNRL